MKKTMRASSLRYLCEIKSELFNYEKKRLGKQNTNPNIENASCLNFDFFYYWDGKLGGTCRCRDAMLRVLFSAKFNFYDRLGKQNSFPNIESASCLNGDFFDFFDYSDTRLDFIKWNLLVRRQ